MKKKVETEQQKRKPGGQPNNQNARTHGYYSKHLSPEQQRAVMAAAGLSGLDYEIALLRTQILSILARDPQNHEVLFLAVSALARLLKTKHQLVQADAGQIKLALREALEGLSLPPEIRREMLGPAPDSAGAADV